MGIWLQTPRWEEKTSLTSVPAKEVKRMVQYKSIHYSSIETQGGGKLLSNFWVSQAKSDFARAWLVAKRSYSSGAWSMISIFAQQQYSLWPRFPSWIPLPLLLPRLLRGKESLFWDWNPLSQLHLSPFQRENGRWPSFCRAATLTFFSSPLGEQSSMNTSLAAVLKAVALGELTCCCC